MAHGPKPQTKTLHPTPYNLNPKPYTLHPTPYNLNPKPYTLRGGAVVTSFETRIVAGASLWMHRTSCVWFS
jgi:hypothetical protein